MNPNIRKIIQRVLFIANILVIILLLVGSSVIIYFSTSEQKSIFGRTALLYSSFNDDGVETHSLYIVDTTNKSVDVGDEIAFLSTNSEWETVPFVDIVETNTNGIIQFIHSPVILEQENAKIIGQIRSKHPRMGESIYNFVQSKSAMTVYVGLGGGFIVCSLIVILLFALKTRRDALINAEKRFETVGDIDEVVYVNDHQPLTVTDDDDIYYEKESTLELPDMTLQTNEIDPFSRSAVQPQPATARASTATVKVEKITLASMVQTEHVEQKPANVKPVEPELIDNLEDQPKSPRSKEIDAYLDEIIKKAQDEFERTYHIK